MKTAYIFAVVLFAPMLAAAPLSVQSAQISQEHTEWIAKIIKEMQAVKVGMTRADLLKVFTVEGGVSTGLRRTYVYRECPYIKVDVEFTAVGRPERDAQGRVTPDEADDDVIKMISQPYLDWSIID